MGMLGGFGRVGSTRMTERVGWTGMNPRVVPHSVFWWESLDRWRVSNREKDWWKVCLRV